MENFLIVLLILLRLKVFVFVLDLKILNIFCVFKLSFLNCIEYLFILLNNLFE